MSDKDNNSQMPQFIQALFGTILGVSFYKSQFFEEYKIDLGNFYKLYDKPETFYFLLFSFTLLIAAHDWFSFHKKSILKDNFWNYVPQIFSLFFLSQMLIVASSNKPYSEWFIYGFFYTGFNILNSIGLIAKVNWWKYFIHIFLIMIGVLVTYNSNFSFITWNVMGFCVIFTVCLVWWIESHEMLLFGLRIKNTEEK